jgi:nucleoside 2-deoxyribosyltransferase
VANENDAAEQYTSIESDSDLRYTIYFAGGLFTQHDIATNVFIKESVWRQSNGKYELILPQSKELRHLDSSDVAAYLRNADLLQVVLADMLLARFDGPDLDTGTVVEFMVAKMLGKPVVVLRSDTRHLSGKGLDDPYNLMVKSWPRTVEIYIDSLMDYVRTIAKVRQAMIDSNSPQTTLESELNIVRKAIDDLAFKVIDALESVLDMKSPYPAKYQEIVYEAMRYCVGSSFEQLLSASELETIIWKLRNHKTL